MARKLSSRQVRYLWAIGYFKNQKARSRAQELPDARRFEFVSETDRSLAGELKPKVPFTQAEENAVIHYVQSNGLVSGYLRGVHKDRIPEAREHVKLIDQAFEKSPGLKEDTRVYRGVSDDFADHLREQIASGKLVPGSRLVDKTYLSTAGSPLVAENFRTEKGVKIIIDLPKGTKALYPSEEYESEVLLERGTEFEVTRINGDEIYMTRVGKKR